MLKDSHGICVLGTFRHRLTEWGNIATVVENGMFYSNENWQPFVAKLYADYGFLYRIIWILCYRPLVYLFRIFRGGISLGRVATAQGMSNQPAFVSYMLNF